MTTKAAPPLYPHRHLLSRASRRRRRPTLRGRTQINLFLRGLDPHAVVLRAGRQAARRRRHEHVGCKFSSVKKGETLIDTAMTLNAMRPDVLIVRHQSAGAAALLAQKVGCSVVNAGDGAHEHPTQALLDALTIRRAQGPHRGPDVAICGDILHSRVARSNILLLNALGARVRVVAPPTLLPAGIAEMGVEVFTTCGRAEGRRRGDDAAPAARAHVRRLRAVGARVFPLLRPRRRKAEGGQADALVMHPGPMNRGVEIDVRVADGPQSVIQRAGRDGRGRAHGGDGSAARSAPQRGRTRMKPTLLERARIVDPSRGIDESRLNPHRTRQDRRLRQGRLEPGRAGGRGAHRLRAATQSSPAWSTAASS
jgi:aspartate carbamoyltransferase catalytic subunit